MLYFNIIAYVTVRNNFGEMLWTEQMLSDSVTLIIISDGNPLIIPQIRLIISQIIILYDAQLWLFSSYIFNYTCNQQIYCIDR